MEPRRPARQRLPHRRRCETDAAGNTASTSSPSRSSHRAPAITARLANDTGSSSTDGITSDPTLTGAGAANAVVHFTVDGSAIAPTTTADASGAWSFTPTALGNGSHTVVASETDAAGNTASTSLTFTLDNTAAAITSRLANDTGSSSTDRITSNPTLTGNGAANAVVHFTVDGSAIAGTATSDASGAWSFTPTGLVNGSHTVVASETDAAGNTASTSLTFTLRQYQYRSRHTERLANATASLSTDSIASNVTLTGTGTANAPTTTADTSGASITGASILEIGGSSSANVNFAAAATGTLRLDNSQAYTGHVSGFSPNTKFDLSDINFASNTTTATYSGDTTHGTLTVKDASSHTANIALQGNYQGLVWATSADGHGGTTVIDPPIVSSGQTAGNATISNAAQLELAPGTSENVLFAGDTGMLKLDDSQHYAGQISGIRGRDTLDLADISFSSQLTLGYRANNDNSGGTLTVNDGMHVANLVLLGSYMATSFVASSNGHGGTFIDPSRESSNVLSPLAQPHAWTKASSK